MLRSAAISVGRIQDATLLTEMHMSLCSVRNWVRIGRYAADNEAHFRSQNYEAFTVLAPRLLILECIMTERNDTGNHFQTPPFVIVVRQGCQSASLPAGAARCHRQTRPPAMVPPAEKAPSLVSATQTGAAEYISHLSPTWQSLEQICKIRMCAVSLLFAPVQVSVLVRIQFGALAAANAMTRCSVLTPTGNVTTAAAPRDAQSISTNPHRRKRLMNG